jgi:hypothetical protein
MSIEIMNLVWKQSKSTGRARLVLLAIADHQGEIGAWPSIQTLADMVNASERSVQRDIQELIALGELSVEVRNAPTRSKYKANLYWVNLEVTNSNLEVTDSRLEVTNEVLEVTESTLEVTPVGVINLNRTIKEPLKETINVQNDFDDGWIDFWKLYPRKQGKGSGYKAYKKALEVIDKDELLEAVTRFNADPNRPTNAKYLPMPATWLNEERWGDDPYPGDNKVLSVEDLKRMEEEAERGYF